MRAPFRFLTAQHQNERGEHEGRAEKHGHGDGLVEKEPSPQMPSTGTARPTVSVREGPMSRIRLKNGR
jgi:hypothetical protein